MDKNSIIGFVLIFLIMGGFTIYQKREYNKRAEIQRQIDSAAYAQARQSFIEDSIRQASLDSLAAEGNSDAIAALSSASAVKYRDTLLSVAAEGQEEFVTLENDKIKVVLTTRGAQPYSVKVKNYLTWDGKDLDLIPEGNSSYRVSVYAGEYISLDDFNFTVDKADSNEVVMSLPFSGGGRMLQTFTLEQDGYCLKSDLSFEEMGNVIPANVSSADIDWSVVIPRLEKGYKNEKQYSKLDYYLSGDKKPGELGKARDGSRSIPTKVKWLAFQQQFFSAILTSEDEFASGDFALKFHDENDPDRRLMTCSAKLRAEFGRGEDAHISSSFYFGPNHFRTLKEMDGKYEKIIPLGGSLVGWISRFIIIPCFNFLHGFISSFGLIILLMTLLIKLVLSPLTVKSYMSSAKMQAIKPEIDELNKKYPNEADAMKKQQAMMDLYRRAGINPAGGCLPLLLQFPLLWAMFRFFPASIELRQQGFLWCKDLSAYDSILDFGFNIPLFGDHLSLFALLMAVSMFLYSKVTMSQMASDDPSTKMMQVMNVWLMPIMMLFICNNLSAGLSYYYFLSNIVTILITLVIKKWVVKPEKIREQLAAAPAKPVKKSKWQMRLEEAQKMQEAQMRKNNKRK